MSHVGWGGEETPLVEEVFQAKRKAGRCAEAARVGGRPVEHSVSTLVRMSS